MDLTNLVPVIRYVTITIIGKRQWLPEIVIAQKPAPEGGYAEYLTRGRMELGRAEVLPIGAVLVARDHRCKRFPSLP